MWDFDIAEAEGGFGFVCCNFGRRDSRRECLLQGGWWSYPLSWTRLDFVSPFLTLVSSAEYKSPPLQLVLSCRRAFGAFIHESKVELQMAPNDGMCNLRACELSVFIFTCDLVP